MEGSGHLPSDDPRFTDMISHAETPSPEPGSLQPAAAAGGGGEAYGGGPSPPFSLAANPSYGAPVSHQGPEMGEAGAW